MGESPSLLFRSRTRPLWLVYRCLRWPAAAPFHFDRHRSHSARANSATPAIVVTTTMASQGTSRTRRRNRFMRRPLRVPAFAGPVGGESGLTNVWVQGEVYGQV